jgi:hypothetical protein
MTNAFIENNERHIYLSGTSPDKYSYETSSGGVLSNCLYELISKPGPMPTRKQVIEYVRNKVAKLGYDQPARYECSKEAMNEGLFRLPGDNPGAASKSFLNKLWDIMQLHFTYKV